MYRMRRCYLITGLFVWMVIGSCSSQAQFTANNQTKLISGVSSNWSGSYIIGSNTYGDVLLIHGGGVLSDAFGYLGYEVSSSNNSVVVADTNSAWSSNPSALGVPGLNLYVGYQGAGNTLTISNAGYVANATCTVGFGFASSNNSVLVTGASTIWSNNGFVYVGYFGAGNSLVISNGAQVISSGILAGSVGQTQSSSNNSVVVTGPGSLWNNWGTFSGLTIGNGGPNNRLVISNNAEVISATVYVGGLSNRVRVVDGGVWQTSVITVGYLQGSNSVVIGGGTVFATNLLIGFSAPTCDNLVQLNGGSLIVTNAAANATLEISSGQLIVKGGVLQVDKLVITNSCASFVHTGGTLMIGRMVLDPNTFRVISVTRQGNDMLITWMMGPGATNTLQATTSGYSTNGFADIFIVTNNTAVGTVTNYLDIGAATNAPARYYRARLVP